MSNPDTKKLQTTLKKAVGTLQGLIKDLDKENVECLHGVQQIDSAVGFAMSVRKQMIEGSFGSCLDDYPIDEKTKKQILKKIDKLYSAGKG